MSSPTEKSRPSPLFSYHSGMFVRATHVRPERPELAVTAPDYLCIAAVKRMLGDEAEIETPVQIATAGVPALCALALAYAGDHNQLDAVIRNLPLETREALRLAVRNDEREEGLAMADRADDLYKAVREGA